MNSKLISILILALFTFLIAKTQDNQNELYFKSLEKKLFESNRFSKVKYTQARYLNGQVKFQRMFVKFKNVNSWRYWMIGKEFVYFKNGTLAYMSYSDTASLILSDTIIKYGSDGEIMYKTILDRSKKYNNVFIAQKFRLFKYAVKWPNSYTNIAYSLNDEFEYIVCPFKYSDKKASYLIDGKVLFFDKLNAVVKEEKYMMGEKIE